ncbi:excisionase family DNA-binding protein [Chloroflexota bacterium]
MDPRRDEIIKLREAGLSYAKIGGRLGLSRERVRQILMGKPKPKKPDLHSKVMLRIGDVASLLGVHVHTVRRWSDEGALKSFRVGPKRERGFRREDVDALLKEEEGTALPSASE